MSSSSSRRCRIAGRPRVQLAAELVRPVGDGTCRGNVVNVNVEKIANASWGVPTDTAANWAYERIAIELNRSAVKSSCWRETALGDLRHAQLDVGQTCLRALTRAVHRRRPMRSSISP